MTKTFLSPRRKGAKEIQNLGIFAPKTLDHAMPEYEPPCLCFLRALNHFFLKLCAGLCGSAPLR